MVDITEQIVREAPDIEAYKIGLLQSAKALADRGVNLPTQQVAGMSGLQNQAINMATQGIGAYRPYVTEAGYTLGDAQTALGGVAAGASPYQQESANFFRSGAAALPGVTNAANQGYQQAGQIGMNSAFAGMAALPGVTNAATQGYQQAGQIGRDSAFAGMAALPGVTNAATQGYQQAGQIGRDSAFAGMAALPGVTNAATQGYQQAGQMGMNAAFAGMAGLNPMAAQAYYNPYETLAVQQAMSDIGRQGDIQQQSLAAKAVGAGAFGGSRQGIESQELNRNVLDQQSRIAAQMRQTGYDSAASRALQAAQLTGQLGSMGSQAQQAAAQGMGQIGMQGAQLTGQLGSMGSQAQQAAAQGMGQIGMQGAQLTGQLGSMGSQAQQAAAQGMGQIGMQGAQLTGQLGSMGSQAQQAAAQGMGQIGMQAADLYGQLGQGIGTLGTSYGQLGLQQGEALGQLGLRQASMGELGQKLGQSEQGFLFDIGKQQQAQQQAEIEAARTSQLQQLYEPYQRVSFLSDIYKGAPSSQQSLTGATTPNISPAQSILGLGIAGLSAASGAQRAGLFG
jgi:hypothetical protein